MKNFSIKTVDQLRGLFFKFGMKSITMDDAARELGISKKTLYEYVPNKRGLVKTIVKHYLETEKKQITEICETSENAIAEFLNINSFLGRHLKTINPAVPYQLKRYFPESWALFDDYIVSFVYKTVKENIIKGKAQNLYRESINESIISKFYISDMQVATDEKLFPPDKFSILDIHKERVLYHLYGLCSVKGTSLLENLKTVQNEAL